MFYTIFVRRPDEHGARHPSRAERAGRPGRRPSPYSTDKIFLFSKYRRRSSRQRAKLVELRRANDESVIESRKSNLDRTTVPVPPTGTDGHGARADGRHRTRPAKFFFSQNIAGFRPANRPN